MIDLVLDTSVIIKWFRKIGEEDREKALLIRDQLLDGQLRVFIPDLLYYELINVFRTKSSASPNSLDKVIELLFLYPLISIHPSKVFLKEANEIAFRYKLSVYDAVYLALAQSLDCKIITADKRLGQKTRSFKKVQLLRDTIIQRF